VGGWLLAGLLVGLLELLSVRLLTLRLLELLTLGPLVLLVWLLSELAAPLGLLALALVLSGSLLALLERLPGLLRGRLPGLQSLLHPLFDHTLALRSHLLALLDALLGQLFGAVDRVLDRVDVVLQEVPRQVDTLVLSAIAHLHAVHEGLRRRLLHLEGLFQRRPDRLLERLLTVLPRVRLVSRHS
jgi:hypothetical protein